MKTVIVVLYYEYEELIDCTASKKYVPDRSIIYLICISHHYTVPFDLAAVYSNNSDIPLKGVLGGYYIRIGNKRKDPITQIVRQTILLININVNLVISQLTQ